MTLRAALILLFADLAALPAAAQNLPTLTGAEPITGVVRGGRPTSIPLNQLVERLPVASFLPQGETAQQFITGQVDASVPINAALAAQNGISLPCGTYSLQHPIAPLLTDGETITGMGRTCVKLRADFATGSVITIGQVGGSGLTPQHVNLSGFTMITGPAHTSGAAIEVGAHYDAWLERFAIDGAWQDEVLVHGGGGGGTAITHINDFWLGATSSTVGGACVHLTDYAVDTYISRGNTNACGTALQVDYASGVYLDHLDLYGSRLGGVTVDPVAGQNVNALFASAVLADTSGNTGWSFQGAGQITDVHLNGIWGSGSGTVNGAVTNASSGLSVTDPALNGLTMVDYQFHHNGAHGIDIEAGTNIGIGAGSSWNNGAASQSGNVCTTPQYDGLLLAAGAGKVAVAGLQTGSGGYMGTTAGLPNCQKYGFEANAGNASIYTLVGNQATGNAVSNGLVTMPGTGYVQAIGNIGFSTSNANQTTIAAGNNCTAVLLGLDPSISDTAISFEFTPIAASGDSPYAHGPVKFWATPVSAGDVQICGDQPATAPISLRWHASAYGG